MINKSNRSHILAIIDFFLYLIEKMKDELFSYTADFYLCFAIRVLHFV